MTRVLLIALALAGFLAGSASAQRVDIDLWEFPRIPDPSDPYDRFSWLRNLIAQFELAHPEARVNLTELSWQNGSDKLKIAVYSGSPPDLMSGAMPVKMVEQGVIDPIDPFLTEHDRADLLPGALDAFEYQGEHWGWPWCSVGDLLYVNLAIAKQREAWIPDGGRWTWDQFLAAMKRMTFTGPEGPVYGFGFIAGVDRSADYGLICLDGAMPLPDHRWPGLDSPEGQRSISRMVELVELDKVAPPNAGGMADKDLWQAFSERRSIACAPFGLWALKALERKKPFPFTVMAFPDCDGMKGFSPTATSGYIVFKQSDERKRRLCHELARFITSGPNQKLLSSYGQFPTRTSTGDIYANQPLMRRAQAILAGGFPLPAHPRWAQMDARIKSGLQEILLGRAAIEAEAPAIAAEVRRLAELPAAQEAGPQTPDLVQAAVARHWRAGLAAGGLLLCAGVLCAWLLRRQLGDVSAYGFLLPSMLIFGGFTVWPVVRALLLAFQDYQPGAGMFDGFVGLENFRAVFADPAFLRAVENTALYTAVVVPAQIALGLVLASLLFPLSDAARHFFRAAFYLPGVASVVVMAMVWRWLYDDSFGLLNRLLALDGMQPLYQTIANLQPLIARPGWALASIYAAVFLCIAARDLLDSPKLAAWLAAGFALAGLGALVSGLDWQWRPFVPIRWLTSTDLSLFSIELSTILKGPGGALLIYLAAMEAIPPELFEAARADGAGPLRIWWHVMLPLVRPTTLFLAITGAIDSFQVFAQVLMMTEGGPAGSSTVLVHQIYTRAFRDLEFGQASAMALLLFGVLVTISVVQYRFLKTDWEY